MINDETTANLAFFKTTIFDDALRRFENLHLLPRRMPVIALVEASVLLKLGSLAGYFDGKSAFELIDRSADAMLESWSILVNDEIVSEEERWCDFISFTEPYTLDRDQFLQNGVYSDQDLPLLRDMFETHLLLASDLLSDSDADLFLEWMGWRPELPSLEELPGRYWSIESFYGGFSKTIGYMQGISDLKKDKHLASDYPLLVEFDTRCRRVIAKRFNFRDEQIIQRYFKVAGQIVGSLKQQGPLWSDAQRSLFENLYVLLTEWDPSPFLGLPHRQARWDLYTSATSQAAQRKTTTDGLLQYGESGV